MGPFGFYLFSFNPLNQLEKWNAHQKYHFFIPLKPSAFGDLVRDQTIIWNNSGDAFYVQILSTIMPIIAWPYKLIIQRICYYYPITTIY